MRALRTLAIVLVLLMVASLASAQSTCVTGTQPSTVQSNVPLPVQFCSVTKDNVQGAWVYGFPGGALLLSNFTKVADYPDGKSKYSGALSPQPKGQSTIYVRAFNYKIPGDSTTMQEGSGTLPFVLSVDDAVSPPAPPSNVVVR